MHRNVSNVWWLAAALGLALAGCGSDSTAPSGRPAAGQIAFSTDRDGNPEIYVMNADGAGVRNLTNNPTLDRKSTRLNSSHSQISYAVFCLKKKKTDN